jgi:hypothetical protein
VPSQEKTAAISSNGTFTVDVSGLNPPYILKAVSTDNSGTTIQMYSVSMTGGRTNINEITDVAVAAAANGTNPDNLYAMPDRDTYRRTSDDFGSIISRLQTVLAPLFALYQVSGSPVDDEHEYSADDNSGLSALLHDVRFTVSDGRVLVKNRATGAVIFSGRLNNLSTGTFYPENMPAGPGGSTGSTTCTSFMYSGWGVCQSNNTQTRTVASSAPAGCTGGTPVLSQSCIYVPPACTYNYATWGACQSNGTQTRTAISSPAGCTGTPILSQSCTYVPTCSSFTYSAWGACQSNNTQTRTVATSLPAGCTGGTPAALSQSCTYVPPVNACTSFTYSAWGACQSNSTQTRTIATSLPTGCTGGSPVVSQACVYVPPVTTVTVANVTSSCTGCHGLTVNGTVFKTGGYTVTGRTASAWLTSINNMVGYGASLTPAGATAQDYANFLAGLTSAPPATCTSFTYSAWGTCQSNSTQTRTVATSLPTGCIGGTPVLSQSCTYVPPTCTYTYDVWGACQSNNTQTRNVLTTSPTGCTGTPVMSQSCTYVPPVTTCFSFTYSAWGTCQSNNTQTRTVSTSLPTGCTGGTPVLSQSCTYVPPVTACTSFTYSAWGACQSNNTQTRTVATSSPAGCTGGTPVLLQSCTYVPPVTACTSFTYSAWGTCQSNSTQTRTVATSLPAGCTGGTPVLLQSCTYVPPVTTCTSFTYSAWGTCQSTNTQTRTVATSLPAGCTGGSPVLSQACTYTPPSTVTMALVQSTCTKCHGLTVNTTVFKTGGYSVSGRTASGWVSALTGMLTPPAGTTIQDFANFLVTVP